MYIYFDSNGYLKEFINDPIREGAQNVNKIYVYVEPSTNKTKTVTIDGVERGVYAFLSTYTTGTVDYKLDDEEITTESFVLDHTHDLVYEQIPFDKKRDLKYFKYFEYYEFLKLTIPSTVTSGSGRVDCSINLTDPLDSASSQLIFPLDMINFMVQDSAIVKNIPITRAQYSYLLAMLKGEINLNYVPYTGAEDDVNLGENSLKFGNMSISPVTLLGLLNFDSNGRFSFSNDSNHKTLTLDLTDLSPFSYITLKAPQESGTIALAEKLPKNGLCATFSTSDFTLQEGGNYAISDIAVSNFIEGSNMLIITWDNCFALCPIPQSGPGRVCAAMWNASGESQVIRIKYELKTNNTLLDISLSGGFTPPSGHMAYVQCVKLF